MCKEQNLQKLTKKRTCCQIWQRCGRCNSKSRPLEYLPTGGAIDFTLLFYIKSFGILDEIKSISPIKNVIILKTILRVLSLHRVYVMHWLYNLIRYN